jgi:hypothetical protein
MDGCYYNCERETKVNVYSVFAALCPGEWIGHGGPAQACKLTTRNSVGLLVMGLCKGYRWSCYSMLAR